MNKIDELIQQLCPDGVRFKELGKVIKLQKGKQLNKELLNEFGKYPAYNGGITYSGFTDTYNQEENTIIISQGGVSAGFVNFVTTKFYANAHCYVVLPDIKVVLNRYVYHYLKLNQEKLTEKQYGAGIPALRTSEILKIDIPVPPLKVQEEIVKTLDLFTELEAELEAELEVRKTQYTYYRDALLRFEGKDVEWKAIGEVSEIKRGVAFTKRQAKPGGYPVVANAPIPICFHNESNRSGESIVIARSGANAGLVSYWNEKIFLTDAFSIHPNNTLLKAKFVYYYLKNLQYEMHLMKNGGGVPHVRASDFEVYKIPIPPMQQQDRIIKILDQFDSLVNDISVGLPAEIQARRKQYEYYRNSLLTFKEVANG
ncbi:MAG: restriction endonuclease subunit S [Saprospiraceae bacterium]